MEVLFSSYKKVKINELGKKLLDNGNALGMKHITEQIDFIPKEMIRVYNEKNHFVGLYKWNDIKNILEVERMFKSS